MNLNLRTVTVCWKSSMSSQHYNQHTFIMWTTQVYSLVISGQGLGGHQQHATITLLLLQVCFWAVLRQVLSFSFQNKWLSRSPMLQRRVYHSMAAVQRKLYVLGGNDLDYNNDRILVRHIDSYSIDADQWTRCSFNMLTGEYGTPEGKNPYY